MDQYYVCWEWQRDSGDFSPYHPLVSHWIEAAFMKNNHQFAVAQSVIDFNSMTQTEGAVTRNVERVAIDLSDLPDLTAYWVWCESPGHFIPYSTDASVIIELAYQTNIPSVDISQATGLLYTIDLINCKQTSQVFQTERDIQRLPTPGTLQSLLSVGVLGTRSAAAASGQAAPTSSQAAPTSRHTSSQAPPTSSQVAPTSHHTSSQAAPTSHRTSSQAAPTSHRTSSQAAPTSHRTSSQAAPTVSRTTTNSGYTSASSYNSSRSTNLPSGASASSACSEDLLASYDVADDILGSYPDISKVPSDTVPAVTGVKSCVSGLFRKPMSFLINRFRYPTGWTSHPASEECLTVDLEKTHSEYRRVEARFKESLGFPIASIKRVQNRWLWNRYNQAKTQLQKKNRGLINEMELFHGSRTTSSDNICASEEGFDMRYSRRGLWGQANYFAVKAFYSHHYANSDGTLKELILAKVLTGDSIECEPDPDLRFPPEKQLNLIMKLKQVRYDSVNGVTQGYKVYMTYSNDRAYPAYIISYVDH